MDTPQSGTVEAFWVVGSVSPILRYRGSVELDIRGGPTEILWRCDHLHWTRSRAQRCAERHLDTMKMGKRHGE